jgi:uncharacterized Zn finger protein
MAWEQWAPYVPVAERRRRAMRKMESLRKKGVDIQPVRIEGRKIAKTFWGEAWCSHLESFSDYENRLPRGRTYVRNGSVCHLAIAKGKIEAKVSGSEIYSLRIGIKTLPGRKWNAVKRRCSGQIGSLLELLQGRLSDNVMEVVTDRENGLFPHPDEITLDCNCPDWAVMCKHVAAVLYGVGARLDEKPELLFKLRGVDHEELIDADAEAAVSAATSKGKSKRLDTGDLSDIFGIDIAVSDGDSPVPKAPRKKVKKRITTKRTRKKGAAKGITKKASKPKATEKAAKKKVAAKRATKKGAAKRAAPKASKKKPAKKVTRKTVKKKMVAKGTATKKKTVAKKAAKKTAKKARSARTGAKKKPGKNKTR